jgi:tRNA A-37 threonylcarbamoyl transferase component Bud32
MTRPLSGRSERPSRVGQELGKLRVERLIGEGGMGTVYEARHSVVGRRMAVKFLHAELASSPEAFGRFEREAKVAGSLESEHIVAVTDFGTTSDGAPYLVMDLLEGMDLAKILVDEGRLSGAQAVDLVLQACRGLQVAYRDGIVHRDLKPENLFICHRSDGTDLLKILDFGIAKLVGPTPVGPVTRTGSTMGTPYYMPPEQAQGDKNIDHRADVYALGVILYEALSGSKPHPGGSYNEILFHILTQEPVPLGSVRPELPPELGAIVHRAMAFDPSARFQSVAELADALGELRERIDLPVREDAVLRAARPPQDPRAATLGSEPEHGMRAAAAPLQADGTGHDDDLRALRVAPHTRASRRALARRWVGAVAAVGALGLGAALLWRPWRPDPSARAGLVVPPPTSSSALVAGLAPSSKNVPSVERAPPTSGTLELSGVSADASAPGQSRGQPLRAPAPRTAPGRFVPGGGKRRAERQSSARAGKPAVPPDPPPPSEPTPSARSRRRRPEIDTESPY